VEEPSALLVLGSKAGEHKFIKEGGAVVAYWEKLGEVVSAPAGGPGAPGQLGPSKRKGAPTVKLACNRDENPYSVADRFIAQHDLPPHFKDQIVQFIITSTERAAGPSLAALPVTGGGCDPLTGGGRAASSSSSSSSTRPCSRPTHSQAVDLASVSVTGGFLDPFSGTAGRHSAVQAALVADLLAPDLLLVRGGGAGSGQQEGRLSHAPRTTFIVFDSPVPSLDKLAAKVREFSSQLAACPDTAALALNEEEGGAGLQGLLACLPPSASPQAAAAAAGGSRLFPALDLARLAALTQPGSSSLASSPGSLSPPSPGPLADALRAAAGGGGGPALLLALRLLANCFAQPALRSWVEGQQGAVLDAFSAAVEAAGSAGAGKAVRSSWATLLSNCAVSSRQGGGEEEAKLQVLSALVELLNSQPYVNPDATFTALVAIATMCHGDKQLASLASDLGVQDVARSVSTAPQGQTAEGRRVMEAALDVLATLK
ncbi:hypothetical protein QJQ45_008655, partial [Haematococcus lacustris]